MGHGLQNHPNSREMFITIFVIWHRILTKTRFKFIRLIQKANNIQFKCIIQEKINCP